MRAFHPALPIDDVLPQIRNLLATHSSTVLVAPTGAGKTTRVPLALLDEPWAQTGKIILLEPRRLAARAAADRMAATLGESVGETLGLRVRLMSRVSARTRIEVVTEGVLARMILDDPGLEGVTAVLFDEFHEESLDADFGLALALDVQASLRSDLRILVMSATLDGARVASLLGADVPLIESQGRAFPVETFYLGRDPREPIETAVLRAVSKALNAERGSILVFLPGQAEIMRVADLLAARIADETVEIAPLYSALERSAQDKAVSPTLPGKRKIVLATSIAETSLTIEGVRIIIELGPVAASPFRARPRLDAARDGQGVARRRRTTAWPCGADRTGRLLSPLGAGCDRRARAFCAARNRQCGFIKSAPRLHCLGCT